MKRIRVTIETGPRVALSLALLAFGLLFGFLLWAVMQTGAR